MRQRWVLFSSRLGSPGPSRRIKPPTSSLSARPMFELERPQHASHSELHALLDSTSPSLGATTIRRSRCPQLDSTFLACEDVEWWIRTIDLGLSFSGIPSVGYVVGDDDHPRILNSPDARLEFSYALFERHPEFFLRHQRAAAHRWRRISVMERIGQNHALARRALIRSLRLAPSLRTARDGIRLLSSTFHAGPPRPILPEHFLPPLCSLRSADFRPLRRGTLETRQWHGRRAQFVLAAARPRSP